MNWGELFSYDSATGCVTWRIRAARRIHIGDPVGRLRKDGYLQAGVRGKMYLLHRIVWDMIHPNDVLRDEEYIDHIDHNRANNRPENLRKVSRVCNLRNQSLRRKNKSGCPGVSWCRRKNKWLARITANYKTMHIGYFESKDDAIAARKHADIKFGFHENHGVGAAKCQ